MSRKMILAGILAIVMLSLNSCSKKTYLASFSPEETGLNIVKITDESQIPVYGPLFNAFSIGRSQAKIMGANKKDKVSWGTARLLSISPDGSEIAYLTGTPKTRNIMVRRAGTGGAATQRTTRNTTDLSWGTDDMLYFTDASGDDQIKICAMDAHKGTLMRQLTSNNHDYDPSLSADGEKLFFTRMDNNGPSIWSYQLSNGELTNCTRGYHPTPIGQGSDEIICVRNNDNGTSEIWRVNYVNGQETLILSDENRGYTHPTISPDGQWLLVVGNTKSVINKQKNLDIFAVKLDGSNMVQLTNHPAIDTNPQWSKDGKSIFFLSTRANKDNKFNIWKMNFRMF